MMTDNYALARIDLRGFPPKPDALLEALERIAALGYQGFALLYDDLFPWTLEDRIRADAAYPEDVVAGIEEWCRRRELIHCVELTAYGLTDPLVAGSAFAYLREVLNDNTATTPYAAVASNMVERVIDDVLALVPGTGLLFSQSSLFPVPSIPHALRRSIEVAYEANSDSPSPWGVLLPDDSSGWADMETIPHPSAAVPDQAIKVVCLTTSDSYGGPATYPLEERLPCYAELLATLRGDGPARTVPAPRDGSGELGFETVIQYRRAAAEAVYAAERALVVWQHGGQIRRNAARIAAETALTSARATLTALQDELASFTARAESAIENGSLALYTAGVVSPLRERLAVVDSRLRAFESSSL